MSNDDLQEINSLVKELDKAFLNERPRNELDSIAKRIVSKGTDALPVLFSFVLKDKYAMNPDYEVVANIYGAMGRKGLNCLFNELQSPEPRRVQTSAEIITAGELKSAFKPLLELLGRSGQQNVLDDTALSALTYALSKLSPREKRPEVASRLVDSLLKFLENNSHLSKKGHRLATSPYPEQFLEDLSEHFADEIAPILQSRLKSMPKNHPFGQVLTDLHLEALCGRSRPIGQITIFMDKPMPVPLNTRGVPKESVKNIPNKITVKP